MSKKKLSLALATISILGLSSCTTQIQYDNPNSVNTTNIGYNSTDLQSATRKLVDNMLNSPAIARITAMGNRPVLFFNTIRNETMQHINTTILSNMVQTKLIQSDKFQITDMTQIKNIKEQLGYQANSGMVDQNTAIKIGQNVGARYMLYGAIQNITQTSVSGNTRTKFFMTTLKLLDLKRNVVIWQDDKQVRKSATRAVFGW